jgi:hypothetical protein
MTTELTETLARDVLRVVDAGLVSGLGNPVPGKMCVEAAVCYAMGLPHSDQPTCVAPAVRTLKIGLNDAHWSSATTRAAGLRRLAVAQLGSENIDEVEFVQRVAVITAAAVTAAHAAGPSAYAAYAAYAAAYAAGPAAYAADAAAAANAAAYDAAYGAYDAGPAAYDAAYGAYDAGPAAYDAALAAFCESVVQALIEMRAPGTAFLYLTEESK